MHLSSVKKHKEGAPILRKIGWLDMVVYRLFFWRWQPILIDRPDYASIMEYSLASFRERQDYNDLRIPCSHPDFWGWCNAHRQHVKAWGGKPAVSQWYWLQWVKAHPQERAKWEKEEGGFYRLPDHYFISLPHQSQVSS